MNATKKYLAITLLALAAGVAAMTARPALGEQAAVAGDGFRAVVAGPATLLLLRKPGV